MKKFRINRAVVAASCFATFFISLASGGFDLARGDAAQPGAAALQVNAGGDRKHVSPTFYGLMTEEINHSYDGGLYAELIQNRSFADDDQNPVHWSTVQESGGAASIELDKSQPVNSSLPSSLRLNVTRPGGQTGVANEGYWGIPVKPDTTYRVSFFARSEAAAGGPLVISLRNDQPSAIAAEARVEGITDQWKRFTVTLKSDSAVKPSSNNHFIISPVNAGSYWFSLVSLMPPTWKDRPNGCRADLMQLMSDLKPAFLRCPGGNYLEGDSVETRFNWKNTLGDISDRPGHMGCWSYRSSDGLGLLEFLEWSEDIGAEPVLAVYAGYSLPTKSHKSGTTLKAGADLQPFVDEAIEEIEYATGDVQTKWGARRAADGHPAPFHIEYVEIGNEDFLGGAKRTYEARFAQFYDALKSAYPRLKYIATMPVRDRKPDAVDDHYYKTSDQMAALAHKYDSADRGGPKVFVGEWATREIPKPSPDGTTRFVQMPWAYKGAPTPSLHAALGDAAFMTGLERNADVVAMNCYAPMLTRVEAGAGQWCPNMIGYDGLSSFGSPSYYVQQMFSHNQGDLILNVSMDAEREGCFYSATRSSRTGTIYLKVVNRSAEAITLPIDLNGVKMVSADGQLIQLTSSDVLAVNSVEEPKKVVPVASQVHGLGLHFTQSFPGNSLSVLVIESQ
jgi:alpha-N-arabinofuranosidase